MIIGQRIAGNSISILQEVQDFISQGKGQYRLVKAWRSLSCEKRHKGCEASSNIKRKSIHMICQATVAKTQSKRVDTPVPKAAEWLLHNLFRK